MKPHQLINQDSGIVEYYTPQVIIEAARLTMGSIDLDPASSVDANRRVKADRFFTKEDDGLLKEWSGNVWLNHPFGRVRNKLWINKLTASARKFRGIQACCITFASTSEGWFQPLLDYSICFLHPRTSYVLPDGTPFKGATKGSCVTYLGSNLPAFKKYFEPHGKILTRVF